MKAVPKTRLTPEQRAALAPRESDRATINPWMGGNRAPRPVPRFTSDLEEAEAKRRVERLRESRELDKNIREVWE